MIEAEKQLAHQAPTGSNIGAQEAPVLRHDLCRRTDRGSGLRRRVQGVQFDCIVASGGGSGSFCNLAALLNENGQAKNVAATLLGG